MLKYLLSLLLLNPMPLTQASSVGEKARLKTPVGGDFSISSTKGTFKTTDQRGKILFLFFGFTHCPHTCPTTLNHFKEMIGSLAEGERDNVRVLFISVDNERDRLTTLRQYIGHFSDSFIAATDSDKKMRSIASLFGARYARLRTPSKALLVDHTDSIFVINRKGQWVDTLGFGASGEQLLQAYKS